MAPQTRREASANSARRFDLVIRLPWRSMLRRGARLSTAVVVMLLFAGADAEPEPPVWQRLESLQKAKVLAALAAFVILGIALMFLAWLGAKATRRYMNREPTLFEQPPKGTPIREKDWAEKPLGSPFEEEDE